MLPEIYDEAELKEACVEYSWKVQNIFGNLIMLCSVKYCCVILCK